MPCGTPWRTFWRRRALLPERRWALRLVEGYVDQLVADEGGVDSVSFAEMKVWTGRRRALLLEFGAG
jgi:hypothetical protein